MYERKIHMKNSNIDENTERKLELLHKFLQLSPEQQQKVIDEIKSIKNI